MRTLDREFVWRSDEGETGQPGNLRSRGFSETRRRVDPGSDRGSAECQAIDARQRPLDTIEIIGFVATGSSYVSNALILTETGGNTTFHLSDKALTKFVVTPVAADNLTIITGSLFLPAARTS